MAAHTIPAEPSDGFSPLARAAHSLMWATQHRDEQLLGAELDVNLVE
jgi:hypothetical protein